MTTLNTIIEPEEENEYGKCTPGMCVCTDDEGNYAKKCYLEDEAEELKELEKGV